MSSEWCSYRLDEVGRIITGKTPKGNVAEYVGRDVPFVTPLDFDGSKWIHETARRISKAGALSVKNCIIPAESVLVTCIGSDMGKAALARSSCVTNQQVNAVVVDEERFCPEFLYYNLSLRKDEIRGLAGGSAQPILNKSAFGQVRFDCPPLSQQKAIAAAVRPLDDRITLLRETNATLEAIAQALFKSWFVDFDPVRAKAEGRQPEGMDAATAALFPDSFEESELGLAPRGWKIGCVADLAVQRKGSINPLTSADEWFEHYSLPAFDSGQYPVLELGESIKSNKTPLPGEAVLLSKLNPHIPRVWLPVRHGENAVCSTEFLAYSPKAGASKELIYCLFSAPDFQQQLCQLVTGTSNSHQRVKPDQILELKLPIADMGLLATFTDIARPIFERVYANRQQSQTLTQLRDTLLPRLISGQLRLPEAEAVLEEVL